MQDSKEPQGSSVHGLQGRVTPQSPQLSLLGSTGVMWVTPGLPGVPIHCSVPASKIPPCPNVPQIQPWIHPGLLWGDLNWWVDEHRVGMMDVTTWPRTNAQQFPLLFVAAWWQQTKILKQTPDTQWPCCYLAGPSDLDKSFVLWFIIIIFPQKPLLASCPSLVSHKAQCDGCCRQII